MRRAFCLAILVAALSSVARAREKPPAPTVKIVEPSANAELTGIVTIRVTWEHRVPGMVYAGLSGAP